MKKYKINAITKNFLKNEQGAYGIATGILSIPLFMIVAFTIDITGALKDKSQLERVLDSAAYTITAENSKFRPKTFQSSPNCGSKSYSQLSYSEMSKQSTECQYYLILADIENRTQQKGLVSDIKRNELMIEATARVFLGSNDLIASANNRITKNIRFDCRRESNTIYPDASGIICAVAGTIKPRGLQSTNSRIDGKYIDPKNEIALGANGVATRADIIPPPMDIVLTVDISAPLIDKNSNFRYYTAHSTSDNLVTLYYQQKDNINKVAKFIGDLETKVFSGGMNPNNRISYLAFSGGGQEVPLNNISQQVRNGEFPTAVPGSLRNNVWPYVIAGGDGTNTPTNEQLTFRFYSDNYFQGLYFPFEKGQASAGGLSAFSGNTICNETATELSQYKFGCEWKTQELALKKPQDIFTNNTQTSTSSLNINDRQTVLIQYLIKRFIQESDPRFDSFTIGSSGGADCDNQYSSGNSSGSGLNLSSQALGINCFDREANQNGNKVLTGISSVFVGVEGLIDPKLTVNKIANFNGHIQNWVLSRPASTPDIIMVTSGYPEKPNQYGANGLLDLSEPLTFNGNYKRDYYSFTPTRNVKNIDKEQLARQNSQRPWPVDSSQYNYVNSHAVLVSHWENKQDYQNLQNQNNTLSSKFSHIHQSGVSFPSSGFLLGANRMMDTNPKTVGQKSQRILVVITHDRNERQDLLISKGLMQDNRMCDVIRKKFNNGGKDYDGTIFIVNVSYIQKNGNTLSIPRGHNTDFGTIRDSNFEFCVGKNGQKDPNSIYLIKAHYNTLADDLNTLLKRIVDENISKVNANKAIGVYNLPMYK